MVCEIWLIGGGLGRDGCIVLCGVMKCGGWVIGRDSGEERS